MLQHLQCSHLSKTLQMVHRWGQEDWLHRRDGIFYYSVHDGAFSEQGFILSEPFGSKRFLLGVYHRQGVIVSVVRCHKHVSRMCHAVFCGNSEREVSVLASSDI